MMPNYLRKLIDYQIILENYLQYQRHQFGNLQKYTTKVDQDH